DGPPHLEARGPGAAAKGRRGVAANGPRIGEQSVAGWHREAEALREVRRGTVRVRKLARPQEARGNHDSSSLGARRLRAVAPKFRRRVFRGRSRKELGRS